MRYFAGFLVAIGLLVLVIVVVIKGFSHSSTPKTPVITLSDYATTGTTMQLTIDGPLTDDAHHQGLRINIGQNQNTIQTYQGYQSNITYTETFPSNTAAYTSFLHSLQLYGFTKGNTDPNKADERGYCPSGNRYLYEIIGDSGTSTQRWWNTSCAGQGNFGGNGPQVRNIFFKQIPDYTKVASKVAI
ncbi:MAG TPA: hypothetical protein VLG11_04005 [Candidatus Saccharimonadales bacterium]|nr:hypothetical protein [Candidatus Saccharimonadales bacterium]